MAKKRPGGTEKLSISLPREQVAFLRLWANRGHGGNLSAVLSTVLAELAEDEARFEAMGRLIEKLGGPILTDEDRERLDREFAGLPPVRKKRTRKAA